MKKMTIEENFVSARRARWAASVRSLKWGMDERFVQIYHAADFLRIISWPEKGDNRWWIGDSKLLLTLQLFMRWWPYHYTNFLSQFVITLMHNFDGGVAFCNISYLHICGFVTFQPKLHIVKKNLGQTLRMLRSLPFVSGLASYSYALIPKKRWVLIHLTFPFSCVFCVTQL